MDLKFFIGCITFASLAVSITANATDQFSNDGKARLQYEAKKDSITHASDSISKSEKGNKNKLLSVSVKTGDAQTLPSKHN